MKRLFMSTAWAIRWLAMILLSSLLLFTPNFGNQRNQLVRPLCIGHPCFVFPLAILSKETGFVFSWLIAFNGFSPVIKSKIILGTC